MFKILTSILSIFGGGVLSSISNDLKEAYQSKLNASNDKERIIADERIALLEARKSSILAAQQSPVERWIRFGFAFPFVVYLNKLLIWDKVLAFGATDSLSPELTQLFWIVIGGYFVDATVRGVFNGRK